jgi:hypothetical protein
MLYNDFEVQFILRVYLINFQNHIEMMLQYGRTLHITFNIKRKPFTIRNAIRESFCSILSNGPNADLLIYVYLPIRKFRVLYSNT